MKSHTNFFFTKYVMGNETWEEMYVSRDCAFHQAH